MADCEGSIEDIDHPPLVLKVDPPEELLEDSAEDSTISNSTLPTDRDAHVYDETKNCTAESNDQESTSTAVKPLNKKHCSLLAVSKLEHSFGINEFLNPVTSKSKSSILRPSQLSVITNSSMSTTDKIVLQPAKFCNPFTKTSDNCIGEDESIMKSNKIEITKDFKSDEKSTEDVKLKFLPLGASSKENENNINNSVASSTSTPSFVFGQNLKERVTVSNDVESSNNSEKNEIRSEESNENGSSELLFSNAAANCRTMARPGLTLTQAAQVLEEANRANKRKYNQVTLLTGEEGETNVLQINCKLFAFDKTTSSWQERGRGMLRLNDRDEESRLVGRTAGTQRLILNTKVWPGMTAERAGSKSLRLTAMDVHGDIRIFIVQAAPKEVDQLHSLLLQRLKRAQERHPKKLATDH
ncbi:PREDICTED: ran-binding protein 3 [Cyphomyrmex costatus]|uniref:Ran-binding protein 3 n=1 Tax=Cyphomyrmex costatus TaxID=456900 RepID=A0A151IKP6_9HYME|nr:PREDICTED: ran-binding protein 3 [Cyphomyrmex costatus]KYN05106.1 Ran-binding protein 3 [Cyphomyrmex costatus]